MTSARGFSDPVFDAQAVFRTAMLAMARPGSIHELRVGLEAPAPLALGTAALALALCDFETPLWLDAHLAAVPEIATFLKFHTGAPILAEPARAAFALVASLAEAPDLARFAMGTLDFPDRSTTLFVQVDSLVAGRGWRLAGPGINGEAQLAVEPACPEFLEALTDTRRLFPRGIDLYFVAGHRIAGLPRTTMVEP
jgi:alpha-D-ribose 1-methylphosphonate 5-triphosphate synthase subunit PhnH